MTVDEINTRVAGAVASIDAGDYAAAFPKLLAAKAGLISQPDAQKGASSLRWDRTAIDSLIEQVQRLIAAPATAAGATTNPRGITRTKITYKRADC